MVIEFRDVSGRLSGKDFVDYVYVANRIAELEDGVWRVTWEKVRALPKEYLGNYAYIISMYNKDIDPNELARELHEIWDSKPVEIRNKYENDILVLFRRDVFDRYLYTMKTQFMYKKRIGRRETKFVYLYTLHPDIRQAVFLRRGLVTFIPELMENYNFPLGQHLPDEPIMDFTPEISEYKTILKLRPYQEEILRSIWKSLKSYGSATIQVATGGGKTEIAIGLTFALRRALRERMDKIFYVTLNTMLLWQAKRRFRKYGLDAGLVTHEYFEVNKPVVMCTIQTLYKAVSQLEVTTREYEERLLEEVRLPSAKYDELYDQYLSANLVIIDESQHIPARTVRDTLFANPYAFKLSMSATPWRDAEDRIEIYATTGKIIEPRITASRLVEDGYLVPAFIMMYYLDLPELRETFFMPLPPMGGWSIVEKKVLLDPERTKIIADIVELMVKLKQVPFLVLVRRIEQGWMLSRELHSRAISHHFLYGEIPLRSREEYVYLAEHLRIDGLIATQLVDEGFDLPPMRSLIIASGGKSSIRALQRVGRVVRPLDPKKYPEAAKLGPKKYGFVIDIVDVAKWFEDHGERRYLIYKSEPRWRIAKVRSLREIESLIARFSK